MQRGGPAQSGILVPPRMDAAPAPSPFAPNDPFNAGMTKGDPKSMPKEPGTPDEFKPETAPVGEKPIEPMPTTEEDPFK